MKILIATVTAGAGHLQAAAALDETWRALRPADTVERVDVLDFVPRLQKKVYAESYMKMAEHAPELWALLFKKTDNPELVRKMNRLRRSFARHTHEKFVRHLKAFDPDTVLCTHYLPEEILGHVKSKDPRARFLTASIVTDFEAHALWMEPVVDVYFVAAEEARQSLITRGARPEDVVVTGIPVAMKFTRPVNRAAVRRQYGLRNDLSTVLVLSGGFGMGPVGEVLSALDRCEVHFQVMVVTGRNEDLRREVSVRDYRHPTHVLGFVTNMHELMAVSDIVLTKPGGLTTSEALAMGRPIFVLNPIPGQEAANSDFLLERGAAVKVNRVEDLAYRLDQLLDSKKLAGLAAAAKALGRPGAAGAICEEVARRVEARQTHAPPAGH